MEKEKIDAEVHALVEQARAFTVTTHEQATGASTFLSAIKTLQKQVRDTFGPLKQAASDAHKKIVAEEKRHLDPLDRSEAEIKRRIGDFMESERRKREAAERAAREEAARIERQRMAEEEAARKAAEEERLKEAARLEAAGKAKEAEKVLDAPLPPVARPAPPPAVVLPPPPRRVEGVVTRETFSANVYSIAELAGYVAANPEKAMLLSPNMPALNQMARLLRQGGAQIVPGVACVAAQEVVSR